MKVDSYVIAKIVGVSQATVSRAFSNPDKVSASTREKIMEAAESLGYKPDRYASALRRKGTNTILMLYVKRENDTYWTNAKRNYWVFSEAVLALTSYFEDQTYLFEVKQINSVFSLSSSQVKEHCDGVIIFDFVTEEESQHISGWGIPYVICHRSLQLKRFNHSSTDNRAGGRIQAEYLKNRGSERPVYITDEEDPFSHHLRIEGFKSVFPQAQIISSAERGIIHSDLVLSIRSNRIDAAAFVNDMHLVTAALSLYGEGYDLQKLYPIIGYDNSTEIMVLRDRPASIDIGIGQIYREAARELLRLIRGEIDFIDLVHQPELIPPLLN